MYIVYALHVHNYTAFICLYVAFYCNPFLTLHHVFIFFILYKTGRLFTLLTLEHFYGKPKLGLQKETLINLIHPFPLT